MKSEKVTSKSRGAGNTVAAAFSDVEIFKIPLYRASAAPREGAGGELRLIHCREGLCIEALYPVAEKKLYRRYHRAAVIGAGGLTDVTAPDGIVFFHEGYLIIRELALFLRYCGETALTLTA